MAPPSTAADVVLETLKERAKLMKESMENTQAITDTMAATLGSFDLRLSALETAMRPTQLKTHSIKRAHENIDETLKAAEVILGQFDLARQAEAKIMKGPHEDLESYLQAVDQLRGIVRFFTGTKGFKSGAGVLNQANNLLGKAISKLEEEFRQLINAYSIPIEPDRRFDCIGSSLRPSAGSPRGNGNHDEKQTEISKKNMENNVFQPPVLIPDKILPLLHEMVHQLIQAGRQQQVFNIYREPRMSAIENTLRKLGVERLDKDDVQKMQWEVLEAKIGNWIHFMRIAVKLLFASEKKLCDGIFEGDENVGDQCFAEITSSSVSMLLSLGEAVVKSRRSPEKLFVLLDIYEIMRELQPEIDIIFSSKVCSGTREAFMILSTRLAQTAQETLCDFEEAVEKDTTKTAVLDGTVHPLTSYVINYIKYLFDYHATVQQLFKDSNNGDANQKLASTTTRIMQDLQTNLEGKSKQYKDPALTHLFLMNNIHYIVRSVRRLDLEAKDLLGPDWVQIHRRIVQQHANHYKRISWSKTLQCLMIQGNPSPKDASCTTGVSRAMVKDRFKTFNILFEEIHQRQSQWTVPDTELRESLRLAVAEVLLPAYRSFIKRYGTLIESGKNPQKYVRYFPEDLETMLGELFEGKAWDEPNR